MMLWAVVAEWVKGASVDGSAGVSLPSRVNRPVEDSARAVVATPRQERRVDPLRLLKKETRRAKELRKRRMEKLKRRESYKESLKRGLRLGHEIELEEENLENSNARHVAVTYKTDPLRQRELLVNSLNEELYRISWTLDRDNDTALFAYNYNTVEGHKASWVITGSGGPAAITARGELGEGDFEQENGLTIRSDVRSHPIDTDLNWAIRVNYLTDNVDLRWKGAVKYPIMRNLVKISHGIERQELLGCCWTLKAEMNSDELPWKTVRLESTGPVTGTSTGIEHFKAELVRNVTEACDAEFEAKTPFRRGGTRWTSRLRHKNKKGTECLAFVEGEDIHCQSINLSYNYGPVKNTVVSCSAGFRPEDGLNMSTALKLGEQNWKEMNQNWNIKAELRLAEGFRRRQADVDLYIPLKFPFSP